MRVAVSSQGDGWDSPVDPRFGRARGFIMVDTQTDEYTYCDNSINLNAAQGAGIQTAKRVADSGAEALVTGNVGPKAYAALKAAGVTVYLVGSGSVAEAVSALKRGDLQPLAQANVEGHWT